MRRDNKCYLRGRNMVEIFEIFEDPLMFKSFVGKLGSLIEQRNDPKGKMDNEDLKNLIEILARAHNVVPQMEIYGEIRKLITDIISTGD